jgi:AcrR family transcriptional regulator
MPKLKPETLNARKTHILQAALTCFASTGYNRTTLDDIVREAGLSKGSIYTYFESKKVLFLELLEKMLADTGLLPILSGETLTGREKLEAAMTGMITFANSKAYQDYAALLMEAWAQSQVDSDVRQTLISIYAQLCGLFEGLIEQSIENGEFKPIDANALASIFVAVFDGLMVQRMLDESAIDWQITAGTIQASWMNGMLASEP